MCFNMIYISKNLVRETPEAILAAVFEQYKKNNDGYSMHAIVYDENIGRFKSVVVRTLKIHKFITVLANLRNIKIIHVHMRDASAGSVSIDNVHMWRVGDFYFSHNGSVYKFVSKNRGSELDMYSRYGYYHHLDDPEFLEYMYYRIEMEGCSDCEVHENLSAPSDTRMMISDERFVEAVKKLDLSSILDAMHEMSFWGVAMLTRFNGSLAIVISTKTFYIKKNENEILVSNVKIDEKQETEFVGLYMIDVPNHTVRKIYGYEDHKLFSSEYRSRFFRRKTKNTTTSTSNGYRHYNIYRSSDKSSSTSDTKNAKGSKASKNSKDDKDSQSKK